jgi:predicted HAD superfamily Cof-like phosphohydrolase
MQDKMEAIFNEIQRSNMSKLGGDGKPVFREDGKVLKGPNYFKPNIAEILEK